MTHTPDESERRVIEDIIFASMQKDFDRRYAIERGDHRSDQ